MRRMLIQRGTAAQSSFCVAAASDPSTLVASVEAHFRALFADKDAISKVPFMTDDVIASQLESHADMQQPRLVRWTCMVQDTSMGTEMAPRHLHGSRDGTPRNGLYGAPSFLADGSPDAASRTPDIRTPQSFCNISSLYGVTLPAQSGWSRDGDAGRTSNSSVQEPGQVVAATLARSVPAKLPLREPPGALLKVYSEDMADGFRVGQIVHVMGILDTSPLPTTDWSVVEERESEIPFYLALHVLTMEEGRTVVDDSNMTLDESDIDLQRTIISLIASVLGGNELVARYVFFAVIARIHTRSLAQTLGCLSLNVSNVPSMPSAWTRGSKLTQLLRLLLPLVAEQSLSLAQLNDQNVIFAPRNDADDAGLKAGRLQLVDGTLLLLDENTMEEGQLKEHGMSNMRTLSTVLTSHKLPYHYPYSNLEMDIDLPCIVLSQGKSILPTSLRINLDTPQLQSSSAIYGPLELDDDIKPRIPSLRAYLQRKRNATASSKAYSISSEVSEKIQDDFVQARSAHDSAASAPAVDAQEAFSQTLEIARLICLSRNGSELQWPDWLEAKQLEKQRRQQFDSPSF